MISLTPEQAARLSEAPVGHLATADANGRPHVIPVCFAYDGQHIYSVLDAKPKRGEPDRPQARAQHHRQSPGVAGHRSL